jgi:hypothetical protein
MREKFKKVLLYVIMLSFVSIVLEIFSFIFINHVYDKNFTVVTRQGYQTYLAERDLKLGWPSKSSLKNRKMDSRGARFSPAYPQPGNSCVSLYGDSFTWSDEVDDKSAWGNKLAKIIGCPVSNFGVWGYGTDQAYLRFSLNVKDESKVVILSHMTGDIKRNVNQWRTFISYPPRDSEWRVFKPRFIINDSGELQLIPLPDYQYEDLYDISRNPSRYMKHDSLAPDGNLPPWLVVSSFPYIKNVLDIVREQLSDYWDGIELKKVMHFYVKDGKSNAYNVTKKIIMEFDSNAKKRDKIPIVLFIPHRSEVYHYIANDQWFSQGMIDELRASGVNVKNYGDYMIEREGKDGVCTLFLREKCGGHFNAKGYGLLAEFASTLVEKFMAS